MTRRPRRGTTLLELVVALLVASLVLGAASAEVTALRTLVSHAELARAGQLERGVAERVIQDLFTGIARPTTAVPFSGTDSMVAVPYRLLTSARDTVVTVVLRREPHGDLTATVPGRAPLVLRRRIHRVTMDYLAARGLDSRWMPTFVSGGGAPEAVRLRVWSRMDTTRCDTILFLAGPLK